MRKVKLPSGAILHVAPAPFADAKALYQAILVNVRKVGIAQDGPHHMEQAFKDAFCFGFSSPRVDAALALCMSRCLYEAKGGGALKIDADTFEPVANREDYTLVCVEVTKENVGPFVKPLFAEFTAVMSTIGNFLGSKSPKTTS